MSVVLLQAFSIKGAFTDKFLQLQLSQGRELKTCPHNQHYLATPGQKQLTSQDRVKLECEMVQTVYGIPNKISLDKFGLKFAEYCNRGADTENMEFATCVLNTVIQTRGENPTTHWYVSGIHDHLNAHIPGIVIGGGEKYKNAQSQWTPPLFIALETSCALAKMLTQKHDHITASDIHSYSMLKRYPLPVLKQSILWTAYKKNESLCCEYYQIYRKKIAKKLQEGEKIFECEQEQENKFFNTVRAIAFYKKLPKILSVMGNWDRDLQDTEFLTHQQFKIYINAERLQKGLLKTGKNIPLASSKIMFDYRTNTEHALSYFQAYMNNFEKSSEWYIDLSKEQDFMSLKQLTNRTVAIEQEVAKNMAHRRFDELAGKSEQGSKPRVPCSFCANGPASNIQLCPDAQCTITKHLCDKCYGTELYLEQTNDTSCATCENFSHVDRNRLTFLSEEVVDKIVKDKERKAELSRQQNTILPQKAQPAQQKKKQTNIHIQRGGRAVRSMNEEAQRNNQ